MREPVALGCLVYVALRGHRQHLNLRPNERGIVAQHVRRPAVDAIVRGEVLRIDEEVGEREEDAQGQPKNLGDAWQERQTV
jgi:hypothetical protein